MLHNSIEFSYFSLQLLEYLIHNHPHRANDYDFITLRGDAAAKEYEQTLRDGYMQDEAMKYTLDNLYLGLHFSLHNMIKDVLWSEFSETIQAEKVDAAAQELYPKLKHLYVASEHNEENYGHFRELELNDVDEDALRTELIVAISKILMVGYGI